MFVDAKDFGCFETPRAQRTIGQGRLSTGFDFFRLDADRAATAARLPALRLAKASKVRFMGPFVWVCGVSVLLIATRTFASLIYSLNY